MLLEKYINQLYALEPKKLFNRVIGGFSIISSVQLFYMLVATDYQFLDIVILLAILSFGLIFLVSIKSQLTKPAWPVFRQNLYFILVVFVFVATIVFSRLPYVMYFAEHGMLATRLNSGTFAGGWYSFITVFFYPLVLLLPFSGLKGGRLLVLLILVMSLLSIDMFVLGTRGIPFFVIFFLLLPLRIKNSRLLIMFIFLALCSIMLMSYQTKARSIYSSIENGSYEYDWSDTLTHSRLFKNLPLTDSYMSFVDNNPDLIGPATYILQYITHSFAEFRHLLQTNTYSSTGAFIYIKDEICLVLGCDRKEISDRISEINPRTGLYQTMFSSLLIDFGYWGVSLILLFILALGTLCKSQPIAYPVFVYLSYVVLFSGIENYLYNGLGLARFILFVLVWQLLTKESFLNTDSTQTN